MASSLFDDKLRDSHRQTVLTLFGVAVTYKKHDGTTVSLTAARGPDIPTEGGIRRRYSISIADVASAVEGETITDESVDWKIVEGTRRAVGGFLHVITERPRIFSGSA